MKKVLHRFRIEILLAAALLDPLFASERPGLKPLAAAALRILPAAGGAAPADGAPEDEWREAFDHLVRENAELRSRLLALGEPAKLVALDPTYWERNPVRIEAAVLGRDASPYRGSVVISAGTREGIREGLAVVVGDRLVGRIAQAGALTSRVRLLSDPGCRVWAEVLSPDIVSEGAAVGTGDAFVLMERVKAGGFEKGAPVYTAGGDRLIPRGLRLGSVSRVEDLDRNGIAEVEVALAVPPDSLRIVNVLAPPE